jgi:hypothetical protein
MTARSDASRREALKTAALGASGLVTALAATRVAGTSVHARATAHDAPDNTSTTNATEAGAKYLAELVGVQLGEYRVVAVGALERGGVPVQLAHRGGAPFRVDVLRADPSDARGIGVASSVSVYLRNGGDGSTATDEVKGLGAMALAAELARPESAGRKPPAALLTMGERVALDASALRIG